MTHLTICKLTKDTGTVETIRYECAGLIEIGRKPANCQLSAGGSSSRGGVEKRTSRRLGAVVH